MNSLKLYWTLFLFITFFNTTDAQTKALPTSFYDNFKKYHQFLLTKNPQSIDSLGKLMQTMFKRLPEIVVEGVLRQIVFTKQTGIIISNQELNERFKTQYGEIPFFMDVNPDSYAVIAENSSLVSMILDKIIFSDAPFDIDTTDKSLFKLYPFYEIRPEDKIAEIGGGDGSFSLYLSFIYNNKIIINELDSGKINGVKTLIQEFEQFQPNHQLSVVQGSEVSTGLGSASMDVILMNNTYHHFSERKKMLQSIHHSLKKDGILYVGETVSDYDIIYHQCPQILTKRMVIKGIEKQGFKLEKQARTLTQYLMKFRKIE